MAEVGETPQQKLARIEGRARLAITIIAIICAVALFIEFLLAVTLPVKAGYDTFLSFNRVGVNPQFQLGLTVFVTIVGILVCLLGLIANWGRYERLLLAFVPLQIVMAVLNMICFVLWALVTEIWNWFGAGLPFALIAIAAAFGSAIAATRVLTMPVFVSKPSHSSSINQPN